MNLATLVLPLALAVIMFGLGLGLTVADFRRVLAHPKVSVIALTCQVLLLPAICLLLVLLFDLPPVLAVGMMLLAASPGGTSANLYSHLFGGDVALNVTLTAINSVVSVFTLPLVANLALGHFMSGDGALGLQFDKSAQVFALVLVPVAVGMLVRAKATAFAERMHRPVKIASGVILAPVIIGAVVQSWDVISAHLGDVGLAALSFSVISLAIGYGAPRLAGVGHPQAVASCMEIGIHNAALSITVATGILGNPQMAVPSAAYGVVMFFTAAAAGFLLKTRQTRRISDK
ncbi:bile acid:sodium symporter family protein [Nonomuraea longicatena]|uniref:Bile acid:sodium symporter family protein n=1 Tax=Nonomuraea longicatena TaxID=83682 RepID=A0ABP4BJS6_9ACTN